MPVDQDSGRGKWPRLWEGRIGSRGQVILCRGGTARQLWLHEIKDALMIHATMPRLQSRKLASLKRRRGGRGLKLATHRQFSFPSGNYGRVHGRASSTLRRQLRQGGTGVRIYIAVAGEANRRISARNDFVLQDRSPRSMPCK